MSRLFGFAIFVMSCLIAQIVCPALPEAENHANEKTNPPENAAENSEAEPKKQEFANEPVEEQDEEEYSEDESSDEEEMEQSLPFLTCVLFEDDSACNAMCSLVGSIYGNPIIGGVCGEQNECKCQNSPNPSLEDYWNKKFNAENILREISKSKNQSEKILAELKTPFKTPKQTIHDLKPHLTAKQLKSLRVKDKEAQKLFAADGQFDRNAVNKYVADKLKSINKPAGGYDCTKTLISVLDTANEDVFDYIVSEIQQSQNKLLNSVLNRYLKEHNIQKNPAQTSGNDQETLVDVLDTAVINQLIRPPPRKTPTRDTSILNLSSSRARAQKLVSGNTANKQSSKSRSSAVALDAPYVLRGFDAKKAAELKKGRKCWEEVGYYHVCLFKNDSKQRLEWHNEKDGVSVEMEVTKEGVITQSWSMDNTNVTFKREQDGSNTQQWTFKNSELEVAKDVEGKIRYQTWSGTKDPDSVEKYKRFINSWCTQNDFFFGEDKCVIYY